MDSAGPAQPGYTSLRARIALAFGAIVVFLALLESGARVFEWISPPSARLLEMHRSKQPVLPEPDPAVYRIYLYGGSTVAGAPLEELSFVAQFDYWLHRLLPGRAIEVVNFGVNGRPSAYVLKEIERSMASPPDLAIVLTGHNEFLGWAPDGRLERLREDTGRLLEETALSRTLRRIGHRISARLPGRISLRLPTWIEPWDRQGEPFRAVVEGYEGNTRAIALRSQQAGVALILATAPANLADWPPVHRFVHDAGFEREVEAVRRDLAEGEPDAAARRLDRLTAEYPGDAMLTWLEGRLAMARGDHARARQLFDRARDADPLPWRALGRFNEHLRSLAATQGVVLADIDRLFRRHSPHGLVGWELVIDNCHPTAYGSALLARELLRVMAEHGLLLRSLEGLPPLDRQREAYRETVVARRPDARLQYLLDSAAYVMKSPFFHFEAARGYLEEAARLAPQDWRVDANLGSVAVLEGRLEEGRRRLERAAELLGGPLRENDRGSTPYLREAMAILSKELEAFAPAETS